MYRPPLRDRPVLADKKDLLIERCKATSEARAAVLRTRGVEVHEAEERPAARFLWQPNVYDLCSTFGDIPRTRRENSTSRSRAQVPGSESASSPGPQRSSRIHGPVKSPAIVSRADSGETVKRFLATA